ncbi:hypothetical protein PVAP13_3NG140853 [Panicum virgatum]|uniref:Uncharacterized protein n=1 Tax=Panicum virgatum TaxID=38727 RepID=A0A8T0U8R6_PANVG|nr:hypothetical protein PVAP13_3NG140853 [Panicum virgatum]
MPPWGKYSPVFSPQKSHTPSQAATTQPKRRQCLAHSTISSNFVPTPPPRQSAPKSGVPGASKEGIPVAGKESPPPVGSSSGWGCRRPRPGCFWLVPGSWGEGRAAPRRDGSDA